MQIAHINGIRVHYSDQGAPEAPALVFANSLGTDFRVWDALVPRLPEGLRIIRYDMRGHGLSDAPEGAYAVADLVADAAGLMDHLGVRDAVFVGLSIGGLVAQGLAAARPELLCATVLSNTAPLLGSAEGWAERIAAVRAGGVGSLAGPVMERWFSAAYRAAHPDEMAVWINMLSRTPEAGYIGCCAALAGADLRASTAALRLPVLVIAGSEDGSTPPDLVGAMAQSIPGARFEIIDGVGHIPCVEAPEALGVLLTSFLREHAFV